MKRILLLFTALMVCIIASSCAIPHSLDKPEEYDPRDVLADDYPFATETMSEVLRCFNEKDSEALKSLFSQQLSSASNIDEQLENAMNYYEGRSVSHDEVRCMDKSTHSLGNGYYSLKIISVDMKNIITDADKTYDLKFWYVLVNDDAPSEIGLYKIFFKNEKGVSVLIVDPDGGKNITQQATHPPTI